MTRPYVVLSCAVSVDGCIGDASGRRLVLSNAEDLDRVDALRASVDAILVGAGTLRADDARLLVRSDARRAERCARGLPADPMRVTLTGTGDLPSELAFLREGRGPRVVYCDREVAHDLAERLAGVAAVVAETELTGLLADLARRGVARLLVEGGTTVATSFLSAGLVDEMRLAIAPFFVGESSAPRLVSAGRLPHGPASRMSLSAVETVGDMAVLTYHLRSVA